MSATVFSPYVMSEMRRIMRGGRNLGYGDSGPQVPDNRAVDRVRRNLFGSVDHSETRQYVERELQNQQDLDSERWGFDFVAGKPKTSGPGSIRYSWKKVKEEDSIPEAYSLRRMPYLRTHAVETKNAVKEQTSSSSTANKSTSSNKQCNKQPKITDYLKKRKRKSCTSESIKQTKTNKSSTNKKVRTSTRSS